MKKLLLFMLLLVPGIVNAGTLSFLPSTSSSAFNNLGTGSVDNLKITISGTEMTIGAIDSSASSYVYYKDADKAPAQWDVTSTVSVTFDNTSDTDGNLFGVELNEEDWDEKMPLFLGVTTDSTNVAFTLSRVPISSTGTTAADVCDLGDEDCDAQSDVMILDSGLTLADWVDRPITYVGSIVGTVAQEYGAWTFSLENYSGFDSAVFTKSFVLPDNVNITASGTNKYVDDRTGTAMRFQESSLVYGIGKDGYCWQSIRLAGQSSASSNSTNYANRVQVALAYNHISDVEVITGTAQVLLNSGSPRRTLHVVYPPNESNIEFSLHDASNYWIDYQGSLRGMTALFLSDFIIGNMLIKTHATWKCYN